PSLCDTATVSISINPVNDAPLAVDDNLTVNNGSSTNQTSSGESSLLANDYDIEGHNLSLSTSAISPPLHGNITLNSNGTFQYDHDGSPETSDSFEYQVCDDGLPILCSNGSVNIVVIGSDVLYKDSFETL
ncbi:MAG: Ig-like domain-containing protein, partial [bacterium]